MKDKDLISACLHKMRVNSVTRNSIRREALKRQGVRQQTPKWKQLFGNNKYETRKVYKGIKRVA